MHTVQMSELVPELISKHIDLASPLDTCQVRSQVSNLCGSLEAGKMEASLENGGLKEASKMGASLEFDGLRVGTLRPGTYTAEVVSPRVELGFEERNLIMENDRHEVTMAFCGC